MDRLIETRPLFIFEMANNHGGSVEHGLAIIQEFSRVTGEYRKHFDLGFKLQYRDIDTFIHPDFKSRSDFKYVKRFLETRLDAKQLKRLKDEIIKQGFRAICTPYDEKSVELAEQHEFDIIKISSASLTDWPLLEKLARLDRPLIASTGGASLGDMDNVVSFLGHRGKQFSLMHCVAIYPTPDDRLQLNQIDLLRERYPQVRIGYSTHETPQNFVAVKLAIAKGTSIFERHVGIEAGSIKLNDYSSTPQQAKKWLEAALAAYTMCGVTGRRSEYTDQEHNSLVSLRRGVFAGRKIHNGEKIELANVFLAIPTAENQLTANDLSKYTLLNASRDIEAGQPVSAGNTMRKEIREKVYQIVQQIKALLKESKVPVQPQLDLEISHHYGIDRFSEYGAAIINYINREYCRKLIIMLPGQTHPEQHHKLKEETFVTLYGDLIVTLDGVEKEYKPGDAVTVEKGHPHIFGSRHGAVIEEVSTTHYKDDSYYKDPEINNNLERKTSLTFWLD